jgi:hypothetical protein
LLVIIQHSQIHHFGGLVSQKPPIQLAIIFLCVSSRVSVSLLAPGSPGDSTPSTSAVLYVHICALRRCSAPSICGVGFSSTSSFHHGSVKGGFSRHYKNTSAAGCASVLGESESRWATTTTATATGALIRSGRMLSHSRVRYCWSQVSPYCTRTVCIPQYVFHGTRTPQYS